MKRLFSPWRSQYIASFKDEAKKKKDECLFCRIAREKNDEKNLVVARREHCFVVMNKYPYNSGHLMIVPFNHTANFGGLSRDEYAEIMATTAEMIDVLGKVSQPQGFNFGANLGRVAGAGIDQHVHFHLVPRWNGDTNFMPTIGDVKLVSEETRETFKRLRQAVDTKEGRSRKK
ncbi:MAG TPA: HIT domain-containing protein [Bacteroidota bacterium]|nr:HIT domain-containing protein [Bacteroidota bacterium]